MKNLDCASSTSRSVNPRVTEIIEYPWIAFDDNEEIEIDYLDKFFKIYDKDKIDYIKLDITEFNEDQSKPIKHSQDLATILSQRLAKFGNLNFTSSSTSGHPKKDGDDYDYSDSFIDDDELNINPKTVKSIEYTKSSLNYFKCFGGDLQAYKNTKSFKQRRQSSSDQSNRQFSSLNTRSRSKKINSIDPVIKKTKITRDNSNNQDNININDDEKINISIIKTDKTILTKSAVSEVEAKTNSESRKKKVVKRKSRNKSLSSLKTKRDEFEKTLSDKNETVK